MSVQVMHDNSAKTFDSGDLTRDQNDAFDYLLENGAVVPGPQGMEFGLALADGWKIVTPRDISEQES